MIKCIRGTKVGDSLIRNEDGSLQPIYPDTFSASTKYVPHLPTADAQGSPFPQE